MNVGDFDFVDGSLSWSYFDDGCGGSMLSKIGGCSGSGGIYLY